VPASVVVDSTYFMGKKPDKEIKVEKREGMTQLQLETEEEIRRKEVTK